MSGCIEMEIVHSAMRPLLLMLGDYRQLDLNVIQRLSSLTQLFPNTFNEKLCEQLLVSMRIRQDWMWKKYFLGWHLGPRIYKIIICLIRNHLQIVITGSGHKRFKSSLVQFITEIIRIQKIQIFAHPTLICDDQ